MSAILIPDVLAFCVALEYRLRRRLSEGERSPLPLRDQADKKARTSLVSRWETEERPRARENRRYIATVVERLSDVLRLQIS